MQEKRIRLKPYSGTGYSTALASPLWQMIVILEKALVDIDTHYEGKASLNKMHSKKQLLAVKSIFVEMKELFKFFTNGIKPGLLDVPQIGYKITILKSILPSFYTPAYSLFNILGKSTSAYDLFIILGKLTAMFVYSNNYVDQISAAFKTIKNQPISDENSGEFKQELKKQLKANLSKYSAEVCQADFDRKNFSTKLDAAIDSMDFKILNNHTDEKNQALALEKALEEALFNTSGNTVGDQAPKKYKKYQFQILDKYTYNFAMQILAVISQAPTDFKRLCSFFDPASVDNLGIEGLGEIKCIKSDTEAETSGYAYQITGGLTGNMQIDIADFYDTFIEGFSNIIAEEIAQYREMHSKSDFVQSELAKTRLIQTFIEKKQLEMRDYAGKVPAAREFLDLEINAEQDVHHLCTNLHILNQIKLNLTKLKQKLNDFNTLSFVDLIKDEADLSIQLRAGENIEGRDTSYKSEIIPDVLVFKAEDNKNVICNIRNYVFENMIANRLLEQEKSYLEKINEIERVLQPKIQDLSQQEINKHKQQNLSNEEPLKQIVSNAKANIKVEEYLFPQDLVEREEYIVKEKEKLAQQINALNANYKQIQSVQAEIGRQSTNCFSEVLSEWHASILENISACYASSRAQAEQCINDLNQIATALGANEENLERELNKVKATLALNKTLQSSDSESIRILKEDKQQALEELLKEQTLLLKEKALNLAKKEPDRTKEQAIAEKKKACENTKAKIAEQLGDIEKSLNDLSVEAKDIFNDKTFQTVEDIQKAGAWLERQLMSYNKALTTTPKIDDIHLPKALQTVQKLINEADAAQKPFPFESLDDKLDEDFEITWTLWADRGFDHFLKQCCFSPNEISKWQSHRQNKLPNDFKEDKEDLLIKVKTKLEEIDAKKSIQDKLETYKKNKNAMESLNKLLIRLESQTTEATNETAIFEKDLIEKEKTLKVKDEVLTEKIAKNEKYQAIYLSNIEIFSQIESIMTNSQQLGGQILEIEALIDKSNTVEKLNQARKQLADLFIKLEPKILQINESMDILEEKIPREERGIDKAYIKKLDELIANSKARSAVIFKVLADNSQSKIDETIINLKKINSDAEVLLAAIKPDNEELLTWVSQQISKFNGISISINDALETKARIFEELGFDTRGQLLASANAQIGDLADTAQSFNQLILSRSEVMVETVASLYLSELAKNSNFIKEDSHVALDYLSNFPLEKLNTLKELLKEPSTGLTLLIKINTEFESQISQLITARFSAKIEIIQKRIAAIEIDETRATYDSSLDAFREISQSINQLPSQLSNQFDVLKNQINSIKLIFIQKKNEHELVGSRIDARSKLVTNYKLELENYIKARKARFFSDDKDERESFIEDLQKELDNYLETGKSEDLIDLLETSFSGYQFKPILNRLKMDIKAQNQPVEAPNARVAANILNSIKNQNLQTKITMLYTQIESIKSFVNSLDDSSYDKYRTVALQLASSLTNKIDQFLLKNQTGFKNAAFSEFQEDFTCLLNSQNDVLSEHVSWEPILANIGLAILAVCTAGISLVAQAIIMKGILQRDSIWVRSEVISKVAEMEDIAGNIGRVNYI